MSSSTTYYPVLTLPAEVTTELFLHCLPLLAYPHHVRPFANAWTYLQVRDTGPVLLKLSQVCSSWRDIVNNTPALWAALTLYPCDSRPGGISPRDVVRTTTWLARARNCPLTLIMYIKDSSAWRRRRFFNTFRRSALRLRVLDLFITRRDLKVMAVAPIFPALERLSLRLQDYCYSVVGPPIEVVAPLLRELVIYELMPRLEVVLPWAQLTKLTMGQYTTAACFTILSLTPNLTECALSVCSRKEAISFHYGLPPADTTIVLPRLRVLRLFGSSGESLLSGQISSADLLDFLQLPALRVLEILDLDPAAEAGFLTVFLARSAAPFLHTLTLHQKGGTTLDVGTFALMPQLVRLEIWRPTVAFADALFEEVFARGGALAMLPRLQILALLGCDPPIPGERPNWAAMDEFERRTAGTDLMERYEWANGFGERNIEEIFFRFKALVAGGMDVRMENKLVCS
ncbi:hypothetical protein C8R44DRAFT_781529 [Mycena epipterygia]|nr:hypothetical protein C8R44DRAFT_781529 [Mycena epipterygia]